LLKAIPKLVNAVDYATTADTLYLVNNWPEGNKYYETAINKARGESDGGESSTTGRYSSPYQTSVPSSGIESHLSNC
jgi:hypothetical protein